MQPTNRIGKIYHFLTVIERDGSLGDKAAWKCKCRCGGFKTVTGDRLERGYTRSCGCRRKGANNARWNGYGEMYGKLWSSIRRGAIDRELEFAITKEFVWNLFLKQDRKCALSGIELSFGTNCWDSATATASLDRKDNTKGYTEDNVQWIHKDLNRMKWIISQDNFIKWCHLIAKNHPIETI